MTLSRPSSLAVAAAFGLFLFPFAAAGPVTPAVPPKARPLPLRDVRLTGGPLKQAQDLDGRYLL